MYNPVIRHLCHLQSDHPSKSSTHLRPYIIVTVLVTVFPVLYFASPWRFCNYQFAFLNPFTFVTQSPNLSSIWQPWVCFGSARSLFCVLDCTHKWNHLVFVFVWLTSLSIIPSGSSHVVANGEILFFFMTESYFIEYIENTTSLSIYLLMDT